MMDLRLGWSQPGMWDCTEVELSKSSFGLLGRFQSRRWEMRSAERLYGSFGHVTA